MVPNPYIQILNQTSDRLDISGQPSAVICVHHADKSLPHLQASADKAGFALIRHADFAEDSGADGYWTANVARLKSLRRQNQDWQLVGLAHDRHAAMTLGEAGADLILFGHLEPIVVQGDMALAQWWSDLFEIPCGLIVPDHPAKDQPFGSQGWPEFFAKEA